MKKNEVSLLMMSCKINSCSLTFNIKSLNTKTNKDGTYGTKILHEIFMSLKSTQNREMLLHRINDQYYFTLLNIFLRKHKKLRKYFLTSTYIIYMIK